MGVTEYKYLCDALKMEIMTLRGDLKKSNIAIHIVTDKKLLSFLPQDAIGADSSDTGGDNMSTITSDQTDNKNNLKIRKRVSLLNLDEEQMIMKYIELRAKFDNLVESSSQKIYELTSQRDLVMAQPPVIGSSKEDKELIAKYEQVIEDKEKLIFDLNNKIKEQESEINGGKLMMECNASDIECLNQRIDKHSKNIYFICFKNTKRKCSRKITLP